MAVLALLGSLGHFPFEQPNLENLSNESVFFWKMCCQYCQQEKVNDGLTLVLLLCVLWFDS